MPDQPAPAEPVLQRDHISLRGTIRYTSKKPERLDQERGRETFQMNVHADGRRTLIAECEIDDRPSVTRYVVHSLDADWLPTDCFVRLAVGDRFQGTGWFRFTARAAECESFTAVEGRVSQRMALDGPCRAFGNHAISGDGLLMHLYDPARGPGVDTMDILLSSPDHRGATGPLLFAVAMGLEYVGEERIEVAAGTFDALHFRVVSTPGLPQEHPPYDIWTSADGHYVFLKGEVGGYMKTHYELVEFDRTPGA